MRLSLVSSRVLLVGTARDKPDPSKLFGVKGLSSKVDGVNEAATGDSLETSVGVFVVVEPNEEPDTKGSLHPGDDDLDRCPSLLKLVAVIVRSKAGGTLDLTMPRLGGLLKSRTSSGEKVVSFVAGVARWESISSEEYGLAALLTESR